MLPGMHEEYNVLLEDEERAVDDDWFNNRGYTFKRTTLNWVNRAREEQQSSRHCPRSSRSRSSIYSKRSSESKSSRSFKSSKEKEVEVSVKMAELLADAQYVEKRQQIESQAKMLRIKQEISKIKARAESYSCKETICLLATYRKILASRLKTSDEKEKLCLSGKRINHCNSKSGNNLSDAYRYDVAETPTMAKDSSKLLKVNGEK